MLSVFEDAMIFPGSPLRRLGNGLLSLALAQAKFWAGTYSNLFILLLVLITKVSIPLPYFLFSFVNMFLTEDIHAPPT